MSLLSGNTERVILGTAIAIGFGLHCYAASQTWIGGDQTHLLRLGASLATEGRIIPFGKLLNGAGSNPGILLQLLFGIPMYIVGHFRAPMILVVLSHCAAYLLLSNTLRTIFGKSILLPFTIVYWLSPWRIYYGSLLWEPAFIYLPAALHFWSCFKMRTTPSILYSAVCVASVIWAMQIHNSFMILAIATGILVWKKQISVNWKGAVLGFSVGAITLIPSMIAVMTGTMEYSSQESQGFIGKGLVTVLPMLKGVLYWVNLGGVEAVRNLKETSFAESSSKWIIYGLQLLCVITVGISIVASWWYFRPLWRWKDNKIKEHQQSPEKKWMRNYALAVFASLVVSAGLSPITLQGWMVVIGLAAATIPISVWATEYWLQKRSQTIARSGLLPYAGFEVVIILVLIFGLFIFNRPSDLPGNIDPAQDRLLLPYIPPMD